MLKYRGDNDGRGEPKMTLSLVPKDSNGQWSLEPIHHCNWRHNILVYILQGKIGWYLGLMDFGQS